MDSLYHINLVSRAILGNMTGGESGGINLLEWKWLAQNLETFSNAVLRALFAACNRVAPRNYDRDDLLEKLMEFLG